MKNAEDGKGALGKIGSSFILIQVKRDGKTVSFPGVSCSYDTGFSLVRF